MKNSWNTITAPLGLVLILIGGVTYGILHSSGFVSFLPLLAGIVLSAASIIAHQLRAKEEGRRRSTRLGIHTGLAIVFLAAIFIFLQTLSSRHNGRIDTTVNRRFSLSTQTAGILDALREEVLLTCFFKETTAGKPKLHDLLEEYRNLSPLFTYRFIDSDKDPVTANRYEDPSYGTVVMESGKREVRISVPTENKITNALLKVTRESKKILYFVSGHGERSLLDSEDGGLSEMRKAISDENYDVREVLMARTDTIPDDCAVLVLAGPRKDLLPVERAVIEEYLGSGGDLLLLVEPVVEMPEITALAERYGIRPGDDIIVDRFGRVLAGNYLTPIVNTYNGDHPITAGFRFATFFPRARSLGLIEQAPEGYEARPLAKTGPSAYAETDIDTLIEIGKTQYEGEKDLAGPLDICVVSTRTLPPAYDAAGGAIERFSRIAVYGDSDFISNAYLKISGNRDLALNTINWLAEEEDLIAIRPKDAVSQLVILSTRQGSVVFWIPVVGLPALIALLGIAVSVRKRRGD